MKNKHGELLVKNVLFILINGIFIILLILFLLNQGNGAIVLEQMYAKEIALSIDYANPIMLIKMDMGKGMKLANKNEIPFEEIVKIENNQVRVKLSSNSGYIYSFFNDVEVGAYPDKENGYYNGLYVITVGEKT